MNIMNSKTATRTLLRISRNPAISATPSLTSTPRRSSSRTLLRHFSITSFPSRTVPLYDKISIQVPTMGDSITEGTIVEWTAQVGEAVKVDDVIALIETDKVTIDIKAQIDGVIVKHFAEVETEVEVGADLYEIDTEAQAQEVQAISADDDDATSVHQEEDGPAVAAVVNASDNDNGSGSESDSDSDEKVRVPSIHFLGKMGWMDKLSVQGSATPVQSTPMKPNGAITLQNGDLPSSYGRLPFSEREIEDLSLGGAAEAPYETYLN